MRLELVVDAVGDIASARRFARARLRDWAVHDRDDTIALLVSETVTNALTHAGTRARLKVGFDGTAVRVEVRDSSAALPVITHRSDLADTGRGLRLLDALASRWGVIPVGGGKTVWFEVPAESNPSDGRPGSTMGHDPHANRSAALAS